MATVQGAELIEVIFDGGESAKASIARDCSVCLPLLTADT